jgi:membrane protein DedA with SNARE-associated domain
MHSQFLEVTGPRGLLIVFAVVLIGQLGVPIPAVVVLIGAGTLAANGEISVVGAFATAMLACVIADRCLFVVGRSYGVGALNAVYRLSRASKAPHHFERWGARTLIIAKFVPGLSTIAPLWAGAAHVSWVRFVLLSGVGSALWGAVGLGIGTIFSEQVPYLLKHMEHIGRLAVIVAIALAFVYSAYLFLTRRAAIARAKDSCATQRLPHPSVSGSVRGVPSRKARVEIHAGN